MNRPLGYLFVLSACFFLGCQHATVDAPPVNEAEPAEATYRTTGRIDSLSPGIWEVFAEGAQIEVLADSFNWSEGPVWVPELQSILFSDVPENKIYKWSEKDGLAIYLKPSGYTGAERRSGEPGSNGLLLNKDGQLVLCQHGDRRIAVMEAPLSNPAPNFRTIVRTFDKKLFNSPNDAVFDRAGNLYFTDPPYGLEGKMEDPNKEIPFQGVYRFSANNELSLITDELTRPNGIALSPDEKTLYVANSDPQKAVWMAFELNDNGELTSKQVFYDVTSQVGKAKGLPDGMKVAPSGHLFATGPGGVWVFEPNGQPLGVINTGEATANCGFDDGLNFLYMTADMFLMRIPLNSHFLAQASK